MEIIVTDPMTLSRMIKKAVKSAVSELKVKDYSRAGAAKELGISVSSIDNLRREGILKDYYPVGRRPRITAESVNDYRDHLLSSSS